MLSSKWTATAKNFLDRHGTTLCTLVAFCVPIKLVWTYLTLLPFLACWLLAGAPGHRESLRKIEPVLKPLGFLYAIFVLSSIAGLSFLNSTRPLISLVLLFLTILLFATYSKFVHVAVALVCGQALAALHSVLDSAFPESLPGVFLGKVTESGQISFTLCLACALGLIYLKYGSLHEEDSQRNHVESSSTFSRLGMAVLRGAPLLVALSVLGFSDSYGLAYSYRFALVGGVIALLVFQNRSYVNGRTKDLGPFILTSAIPLVVCALLVNLKRGPWLGLVVSWILAMIVLAPRLVPMALAGLTLLIVSVAPVRDRISESYSHFTIYGGRKVIWEVGAELSTRYPLGIGFQNSPILREYSTEIPPELRHFHNNFLNILVEAGPLGLGAFVWLIAAMIIQTFSRRKSIMRSPADILSFGTCLAIIAWQTAGLVEYNFGDTEVVLVFFILTGAVFAGQKELINREKMSSTMNISTSGEPEVVRSTSGLR